MSHTIQDSLDIVHPEWRPLLQRALSTMDVAYLQFLSSQSHCLPSLDKLFAAFHLPPTKTRYILFGESPYPRPQSANGYAFWDNAVTNLWSVKGFSKTVNRATSLRNMLKMFLVARGDLIYDLSQSAIAILDKSYYIHTAAELFNAFMDKGFLLLNASLVYEEGKVPYHARQWRAFVYHLLSELAEFTNPPALILFGRIADQIPKTRLKTALQTEHPYNLSFIRQPANLEFFKPFDLLAAEGHYHEKFHC